MSFSTATNLLGEVLPIKNAISVAEVKRRVRVVAKALEQDLAAKARPVDYSAELQKPGSSVELSPTALAVDSAWLKYCGPERQQGRHVNLVVGRACFVGGRTRVYSYVHKLVDSAATRLDQFLASSGVNPQARVTLLTDGAGEFEKAAKGCAQPMCHILDWFHIAMKFKVAERSVFGCKQIDSLERWEIEEEIRHVKWLVWHGKASKAVGRLRRLEAKL